MKYADSPFFSLIIPVYNAGKNLLRCVESILRQDFKSYEVILIDDGSTDGVTLSIEQELAEKNQQVRVVRETNAGTSTARNRGLFLARGKYISFLDQDDYWLRDDVLREIKRLIAEKQPDIVFSNYYIVQAKRTSLRKCSVRASFLETQDSFEKRLIYLLKRGGIGRTVWCVFFKGEMLKNNDISFPDGRRYEDFDFIASCLMCSDSLAWFPEPYYAYNLGVEGQQTSQKVTVEMCNDLETIILTHANNVNSSRYMKSYLAYLQFVLFCERIMIMGWDSAYSWLNEHYSGEILLAYLIERPYSFFGGMYKLFGLSATFWVLDKVLKIRKLINS